MYNYGLFTSVKRPRIQCNHIVLCTATIMNKYVIIDLFIFIELYDAVSCADLLHSKL